MKEVDYNELNGKGRYMLTMRCEHCGREINRTRVLDNTDIVRKMYNEAQADPMVNWCSQCDCSGDVHIWEVGEMDGTVYLLSIGGQQKEIDHYCFRKCGKISLGCVTIPTEDGEAVFMPCRAQSCEYAKKEFDIGKGKTKDSILKHYIVRQLNSTAFQG
ncbi:MAG: hypothetical protein PVF58_19240 [Candidatus Methanofastidiosia archaeon]|jgi:hypothetical protein